MNGWTQKGIVGLIGAAAGAGLLLLTMSRTHDVGVGLTAAQATQVQELLVFKEKIEHNVEEWRGDQERYKAQIAELQAGKHQAEKERAAMLRWMERVSARLNIAPPTVPLDAQRRGPGDLQAADPK